MAHNGFGRYLPTDQTDAERRSTPGYRRGLGQYVDGTRDTATTKRAQLAEQRRERIRQAIADGTATFGFDGKPVDPLAEDPDAVEAAWQDAHGDDDGGAA
ncbi:hypothetical protein [Gordonia humi]|uniref:Uncharacterized protein n=1 Tax=Gordonia humi TaxID=686429 RepID=A0A840F0L3_9ACTN|nr:hypothetical protein [Gordonia humi]MBB4136078.1 hypothetical protein [Gordonia humi]